MAYPILAFAAASTAREAMTLAPAAKKKDCQNHSPKSEPSIDLWSKDIEHIPTSAGR
jgi:hypothetical protein